jgi:hypothetical protein
MDTGFPPNWTMYALTWFCTSGLDSAKAKRRSSKLQMCEKASATMKRPLFGGNVVPRLGRCPQRQENESHCSSSCRRLAQALSEAW